MTIITLYSVVADPVYASPVRTFCRLCLAERQADSLHYTLELGNESGHSMLCASEHCVLFCGSRHNELQRWATMIDRSIASRSSVCFEPIEPNFEFHIDYSEHRDQPMVYVWIDSANHLGSHYSLDAVGVRMICSASDLADFAGALHDHA